MSREFNIQVKHGKVMGGSGVFMDAENIHVVEYSALELAQSQLAIAMEVLKELTLGHGPNSCSCKCCRALDKIK